MRWHATRIGSLPQAQDAYLYQHDMISRALVPATMNHAHREATPDARAFLVTRGFRFAEDRSPHLLHVATMPQDWQLVGCERFPHLVYCIDHRGNRRACADFGHCAPDGSGSHLIVLTRFTFAVVEGSYCSVRIMDDGKPTRLRFESSSSHDAHQNAVRALGHLYSDWQDPGAHWDDPGPDEM